MSDQPDETVPEPFASHTSLVTQAGFTMMPNVVMLRKDLKPTAKLVYGYLKHLAWRMRDPYVAPTQQAMADDLGTSVDALQTALRELQQAPSAEGDASEDAERLIVSTRRGLGLPNRYLINDPRAAIDGDGYRESRQQLAVDAGVSLSSSKTLQPRQGPPVVPRKRGSRSTSAELERAEAILTAFNEVFGTRFATRKWVTMIAGCVHEHPEVTDEQHAVVARYAKAHPWWKRPPTPAVVYGGGGAQFEGYLHAAFDDNPDGMSTYEETKQWLAGVWGKGTPYATAAEARRAGAA